MLPKEMLRLYNSNVKDVYTFTLTYTLHETEAT